MATRTIFIAGAGIAGMTQALALAKFGATAIVLERHAGIAEAGAGLQLGPNARRVLNHLGLDRQIAERSFVPTGIDIYGFRSKAPIQTLQLGTTIADRFGAPYAVMHRADLAEILRLACRRFANIDISFGIRAYDTIQHARGLSVEIEEADGRTRTGRPFAFVGADGVNSPTRTNILAGPPARFDGTVAWRALVDLDALKGHIADDRVSVIMAPGFHAVCYPLAYRNRLNVVLFAKSPAKSGTVERDEPKLPWAALRSPRIDAILAAAKGSWGAWPLGLVDTPRWHEGAVGIIGDAAHAMPPFQAQGAAMAIEDAAALAPLLMSESTAEAAFSAYEVQRRKRVRRVTQTSAANGRVFHMEWPLTVARNAVIRVQGPRGHFRRLAWLYDHDPLQDPLHATQRLP
ncbi:MAG: hypothetical protein JWR75_1184 [Devosia sp.]|nr:hypothetical protein [Devosia sp.]